jgi:hypothetical protein
MPLDPIGGLDLFERVSPLCPACPPLFSSERPRRLPGTRGFFFNPSLDDGLELLELSRPNRRWSSIIAARNASFSAHNGSPLRAAAMRLRRVAAQCRHERVDRVANQGRAELHLHLDSRFRPARHAIDAPAKFSRPLLQIGLTQVGCCTLC